MKTISGWLLMISGIALGIFSIVTIHNDMTPNSIFDIVYTYEYPLTEHEISMMIMTIVAVIVVLIGLILIIGSRSNGVSQSAINREIETGEKSFERKENSAIMLEENDTDMPEEDDVYMLEENDANMLECPKCGGPNAYENEVCQFCDYRFRDEDMSTQSAEKYSDDFLGRVLIGGLFFVGGILALIYGSYLNNDMEVVGEYMWNYGRSDPGMKWIIGGGIGAFVGVIIFIWKRLCHELTKYAPNEEVQAKSTSTCKKEKQTEYSSVETVVAYHIAVNGQATGPYSMEILTQMADAGQITGDTLVWKNGMTEWVKATEIEKLNALVTKMPPIPPSE